MEKFLLFKSKVRGKVRRLALDPRCIAGVDEVENPNEEEYAIVYLITGSSFTLPDPGRTVLDRIIANREQISMGGRGEDDEQEP